MRDAVYNVRLGEIAMTLSLQLNKKHTKKKTKQKKEEEGGGITVFWVKKKNRWNVSRAR